MRAAPSLVVVLACGFGLAVPDALPNETKHSQAIVSHIPRAPVDSTGIAAIGYSKRLHALEIEFVNGAIYRYAEVPTSVYRALMAAKSKAQFYDRNIRGKFHSIHVRPRTRG
jgi:hypothetical protein